MMAPVAYILMGWLLFPAGTWQNGPSFSSEIRQEFSGEQACQKAREVLRERYPVPSVVALGQLSWVDSNGKPPHTLSDTVFRIGGYIYLDTEMELLRDYIGIAKRLRVSKEEAIKIMEEVETARPPNDP